MTIERSIDLRELALVLVKSKEALMNATERLVMLLLVSLPYNKEFSGSFSQKLQNA